MPVRCATCGEPIGVYEPLLVLEGDRVRETSHAAEPELPPDAHVHRTCFRGAPELPQPLAEISHFLHGLYPAGEHSLGGIRGRVALAAERAGVRRTKVRDIELAVSEAAANAVRHAYRGGEGSILVTAFVAHGSFHVRIADEGCGMGNSAAPNGMGLGLRIMADCADQLAIHDHPGGGAEVEMRFDFIADAARSDHVDRASVPTDSRAARP